MRVVLMLLCLALELFCVMCMEKSKMVWHAKLSFCPPACSRCTLARTVAAVWVQNCDVVFSRAGGDWSPPRPASASKPGLGQLVAAGQTSRHRHFHFQLFNFVRNVSTSL